MFIVIEGDDRTGKDTLISGICKATQWGHVIIPRGPAGYAAYDMIYDRYKGDTERFTSFLRSADALNNTDCLFVYCYGDPKILYIRRQNEIDDGTHPEAPKGKDLSIEDIQQRLKTYKFIFDTFYKSEKRIYLDSTVLTPEEMVEQVLTHLKK